MHIGWLDRIIERRRARHRHRAARRELEAMDARQLADLGITRDQITDYLQGRIGPDRPPSLRLVVSNPGPRCCPLREDCCIAA